MAKQKSNGQERGKTADEAAMVINERLAAQQYQQLTLNILTSRWERFRKSLDPRRDLNDECGYKRTTELTPEVYQELYERESIATRVVEVMPKECWKSPPTVYEDEDVDTVTPFEQAWDDLGNSLRGPSWHQDEEGSPIWEHLRDADIDSGIGHYGVLLIGLDDGLDLDKAVEGINDRGEPETPLSVGSPAKRKIIYLRSFGQVNAKITKWETEESNPRYCKPTEYMLTLTDPNGEIEDGGGLPAKDVRVHWSRVIHIADNRGIPRMRPVYNRLYDLCKLYGGSAEMYWQGAFAGLSLETHPTLGGDVPVNVPSLARMMWDRRNGIQRDIVLQGMHAKSLAPQVVDPAQQIDVQLTAICIVLGIPKRKFMGSERGELASSEDESDWNDTLKGRQCDYLTPHLIIEFVNRLILMKVLPTPKGYSVDWPDLSSLSEGEKADIALKKTQACSMFVQGQCDVIIEPMDWWTRIMGSSEEEAQAIVDNAVEHLETANPDAEGEIVAGRNPTPPELEEPAIGEEQGEPNK